MLLVKARVGVSKVHGFGLIADEFIPAGAIVWQYHEGFDVVIPHAVLQRLSTPARLQAIHYAAYFPEGKVFILSSDDYRFINHSDYPNVGPADGLGGGIRAGECVALCDIREGDEMTCNYRKVMMLESWLRTIPGSRRAKD